MEPQWETKKNKLYRRFVFESFGEAFVFISKIAELAEQKKHHPEIYNLYNVVEVWLSTHEAGDTITDKDTAMAEAIGSLFMAQKDDSLESIDVKNTTKSHFIIHTDGGSRGNPGPSAAAYVVLDDGGAIIKQGGRYLGVTTNNQAEYQAVLLGLEQAKQLCIASVEFKIDSLLVVNQLNGVYKIKNQDLLLIYEQIIRLAKSFALVSYTHVRREHNTQADGLVNKILDEHEKSA